MLGSRAIDYAREQGHEKAFLWFPGRDEAHLRPFYEGLGWVQTEVIEYLNARSIIGGFDLGL